MSIFTSIPTSKNKRTTFDLSHSNYFTMRNANCYPAALVELAPNDGFSTKVHAYIRAQKMTAPIFSKINVNFHHFAVPLRTVIPQFTDYIYQDADGTYTEPYTTLGILRGVLGDKFLTAGELADFMGMPVVMTDEQRTAVNEWRMSSQQYNTKIRLAPFLAYWKIWNDWFRNPSIEAAIFSDREDHKFRYNGAEYDDLFLSLTTATQSGKVDEDSMFFNSVGQSQKILEFIFQYFQKGYQKDYFTSALPYQQAGSPVNLPIGDEAPLYVDYKESQSTTQNYGLLGYTKNLGTNLLGNDQPSNSVYGSSYKKQPLVPLQNYVERITVDEASGASVTFNAIGPAMSNLQGEQNYQGGYSHLPKAYADLAAASGATVNEFRSALAAQRFLEKKARSGPRYGDVTNNIFHTKNRDPFKHYALYLGGHYQKINVSEVIANNETQDGDTLGQFAGRGYSVDTGKYLAVHTSEHMLYMCIVCVTPEATYCQGLPKMLTRLNNFDYPIPEFAHLGEQEILKQELYFDMDGNSNNNRQIFGYTPRYSEFKFAFNEIHGEFMTNKKYFSAHRLFSQTPSLNGDFIKHQVKESDRIFGVSSDVADPYNVQLYFKMKKRTALPYYGEPR